jgi:hypothetical protein
MDARFICLKRELDNPYKQKFEFKGENNELGSHARN